MSDIDKAEELLKKFVELIDPSKVVNSDPELWGVHFAAKEYLSSPVIIKDWNDEEVRIYVDSDKDVSFEWDDDNWTPDIIAFDPDELLRGLREIGVIQ